MIDNDLITALAREYAEDNFTDDKDFIDEAENTIRFLLRNYYLVEKSKVKEKYRQNNRHHEMARELNKPLMVVWFKSSLNLLEEIFPDLEKEAE